MDRRFYDLAVQSDMSSGVDPVQALADRAERLGFAGIAVTDYVADRGDVEAVRDAVRAVDAGIDVHVGATIRPDGPGDMKEMLTEIRDRVAVLAVHGGDADINRAATGDTRVDILAHPEMGRTDSGLDHVMAEQAADNRVAVAVTLRPLLAVSGKERAHVLSHMRRNVRLCAEFDAPVIAISGATAAVQMRAPRELAAFPRILGMDLGSGFDTVSSVPHRILERSDRVMSDKFVRPGVEVVEGDADG